MGIAVVTALCGPACRAKVPSTSISASGHVEATDVRLSAKVPGRLASFSVQEGDAVKAGQEVARIDITDLQLALTQARAERDGSAAELRLRVAGPRHEDIAEVAAQVESLNADVAGAQQDLKRMQALLDKGSGTTKSRDDAKTRLDVLSGRLAAARQTLARLRAGSRAEEVDGARARVAGFDARIAQLDQQVKDATIVSPVNGVLTERIAEPGELLQVGSPIGVITDLSAAWLTVYVDEPDLARIRIGQAAEIVTDDGQKREGKVTFIASKAEFTPKNVQTRDERVKLVYRVKVGLDNSDGLLKPGMPAEARFTAMSSSSSLGTTTAPAR
jgi:HlyD family secretion protein